MDPTTIQMKVKSENFLIMIFWLFMMVAMLAVLCIELGSGSSPLYPISMLLLVLGNLRRQLPSLLNKSIRFESDCIVLERRMLKPLKLRYTSLQYIQNDFLVFSGFTLNADEYENTQALLDTFQHCADAGLLSLQSREMKKKKKRATIVSVVILALAVVAIVIYIIFLSNNRQLADTFVTVSIFVYMIVFVSKSFIQWRRRVRQFQ